MSDSLLEVINEGDTVRLRDGTVTTVQFIAYMPDDLHMDYDYVVRLDGYGATTFTESGLWAAEKANGIDIIEVQGKLS